MTVAILKTAYRLNLTTAERRSMAIKLGARPARPPIRQARRPFDPHALTGPERFVFGLEIRRAHLLLRVYWGVQSHLMALDIQHRANMPHRLRLFRRRLARKERS